VGCDVPTVPCTVWMTPLPLPLLAVAAVDADVVEADDPTDAALGAGAFAGSPAPLAGTDAAGTDAAGTDAAGTDAAGTDAAGTDAACDATPATGWVTTDIRPDEPASVVPG
jgi:hypothetical protein